MQHEILETPVTIYNFEVEDFHTYYVGEQSVLVHNNGCGDADFVVYPDGTILDAKNVDISPVTDPVTGVEVGRFAAAPDGTVLPEPVGGRTVAAGPNDVDTHTLYPNGSNCYRYNPQGHRNNPTPHGHAHSIGTGAGRRGQGASLDVHGNTVSFNSSDAHWPIN